MLTLKYGFTGTRSGMNDFQKQQIINLIQKDIFLGNFIEVHHGDCLGADKDMHDICEMLNIKTIIHPPIDQKLRAFCNSNYIHNPKQYLCRNKDIVNDTDILLACPFSKKEEYRSGTWSTIRYAKKCGKNILIF